MPRIIVHILLFTFTSNTTTLSCRTHMGSWTWTIETGLRRRQQTLLQYSRLGRLGHINAFEPKSTLTKARLLKLDLPVLGTGKRDHYERGLFTGGISRMSKISKLSRISRNGRILIYFPQSGRSLDSLESLNSLESLENGLF